ncbi:MAG: hypothetical protein ABGZ53_10120 [Fuerstiella sp.]
MSFNIGVTHWESLLANTATGQKNHGTFFRIGEPVVGRSKHLRCQAPGGMTLEAMW